MLAVLLLLTVLAPQERVAALPRLDALPGYGQESFEPFRFVQIGDPQIGFGGAYPDARRFETLAEEVAATDAAFGIVVGDLVQDRLEREYRLLQGGLEDFTLPLAFVPGNHDVLDVATLEAYRRDFGRDYYSFLYNGCGFIGLNSELLPGAVEGGISVRESADQWAWFEAELEALASKDLRHVFLFLHRPPTAVGPGVDSGDPLGRLIRESGIRAVLAGHLHATEEIEREDGAFTIFTVGGTSRLFDDRGFGYRIFDVREDGIEQSYVEFDRPSDHWLVTNGWTPRILDPSLPHWVMTLVFLTACICCVRAYRRPRADSQHPLLWLLLGIGYGFLALNQQLDLDEILVATGRHVARSFHAYGGRRMLQAIVLGVGGLAALIGLILARKRLGRSGPRAWIGLVGFSLPAASFLLHALSLHQTEALMYALGRGGLYAVETVGAVLSCWAARR